MPDQAMNRIWYDEDMPGGFSNKKASGSLPVPLPSPLFLNLGCGNDVRDGFVNIDLFNIDARVVAMDIRKLQLPDECADIILASDVLEHFSHRETSRLLNEWSRVLKPGGELVVRCPSLKLQAKAYLDGKWNADIASYMIFGGQTNPGDYHANGFDEESIKEKLQNAGLNVTEFEEVDTPQDKGYINLNMTVRASKPVQNIRINSEKSLFSFDQPAGGSRYDFSTPVISEIKEAELPQLNIVWEGSQFLYHSLALINREQCSNIIDSGAAELTIVPFEADQFANEGDEKYDKLKRNDIRIKPDTSEAIGKLPYVWIRHQWPPKDEVPNGAKWIIMQPWEFGALPADFVEIFNKTDEIWTPSNASRKAFINSGISKEKVQIVPNGINPELFTPKGDKYKLKTDKPFKYLYVGGTIYRKGFDILLDSYLSVFNSNDDVCLVVKDMGGNSFYRGQTAEQRINEVQNNPNSPEIIYINEDLSESEIASLYRACDVFVLPYRGEGFSLPVLEAMACGLPVVVTEGGSTDDFVDEFCGRLIPSEKLSIGNTLDDKPLVGEGFLLEPDKKVLSAVLKLLVNDPTNNFTAGLYGSFKARSKWTWKKSTLKVFSRLDVLYGTSMAKIADKNIKDCQDEFIDYCLAEISFGEGSFRKAEELFVNSLKADNLGTKYRIHALNRLAQTSFQSGMENSGLEYLYKAVEINPNNPDSHYLKALYFKSKGLLTEALEEITQALDKWSSSKYMSTIGINLEEVLITSASIMFDQEDLEGAHQLYTSVLQINHENADACIGAGKCFKAAGVYDQARIMFEWALKLKPGSKIALDELESL